MEVKEGAVALNLCGDGHQLETRFECFDRTRSSIDDAFKLDSDR